MAKAKNSKPATPRKRKTALAAAVSFVNRINFDRIDPKAEYTTREAAGLIKISQRRLRLFCKEGRVGHLIPFSRATKAAKNGHASEPAGGFYVIKGAELIAFARTPRPTGRAGQKQAAK